MTRPPPSKFYCLRFTTFLWNVFGVRSLYSVCEGLFICLSTDIDIRANVYACELAYERAYGLTYVHKVFVPLCVTCLRLDENRLFDFDFFFCDIYFGYSHRPVHPDYWWPRDLAATWAWRAALNSKTT